MKTRRYSELILLPTFRERFDYLKLHARVGVQTFGFDRYINQLLYKSREWAATRNAVIVRDDGCDLGLSDFPINGGVRVHHVNPITVEDIEERSPLVFDPEFLISSSLTTHNALHYGTEEYHPPEPIIREAGDTTPWR